MGICYFKKFPGEKSPDFHVESGGELRALAKK